ncbi:MAG: cytochrome-c peroxidase [Saprospiraceae bacterium]
MSSTRTLLILCLFVSVFTACREDGAIPNAEINEQLRRVIEASGQSMDGLRLPASDDLENIPQDPKNPLTPEKVALGKLLFHETALGIDGMADDRSQTWSCASCHHADAGFAAGTVQGIGEGGNGFGLTGEGRSRAANLTNAMLDVQPLKSPSILNTGYQKVTLWNGQFGGTGLNEGTEAYWTDGTPKASNNLGFEGVETQAIAGLKVHRLDVNEAILDTFGYRALFDKAFSDIPVEDRYTRLTSALAIAAFERTVLANEAPFQQWLAGDIAALNDQEKAGAAVFFGDGDCASCHNGPSLASMSFHAYGMNDLHDNPEPVIGSMASQAAHKGRGGFTLVEDDMYKFKTPQLYNLADSRFYGHGSSFRSVRDVIEYKSNGQSQNERVPANKLSSNFTALNLSQQQIKDLTAFLEDGLRDPNLKRYTPESLLSGKCFPNADALSQADMGCN